MAIIRMDIPELISANSVVLAVAGHPIQLYSVWAVDGRVAPANTYFLQIFDHLPDPGDIPVMAAKPILGYAEYFLAPYDYLKLKQCWVVVSTTALTYTAAAPGDFAISARFVKDRDGAA